LKRFSRPAIEIMADNDAVRSLLAPVPPTVQSAHPGAKREGLDAMPRRFTSRCLPDSCYSRPADIVHAGAF
jgi:hypothetical protein